MQRLAQSGKRVSTVSVIHTETFGDLLRLHRQAAGLTQEQLAERANLSLRAVSDLERGIKQHPRRQTVQLLAAALDLAPEQRAELERAGGRSSALAPSPPAPPTVAPPVTSDKQTGPHHNLPLQTTSFIGRERELRQLEKLLWKAGVRLVTLTGAGGSGKTRLALEVAASLLDDFADGVYFVNLAPVAKPEQVPAAIAGALQVKEVAGEPPLASLKAHLQQRSTLLILDNFEHLLAAATVVAELLAAAGRLKVLATSREPLRLRGEHQVPVAPLPSPAPSAHPQLEQLARNDAVRLFFERASAARLDFMLTDENIGAVAAICQRLDGLPLAIELAAARIKVLTPQMLLQRLESRLNLLLAGERDLPARQRTLRSTIAWSYELLPEDERLLFRRLAVFRGGRTLEGVSAVCNADGDLQIDVLDGLVALVDKSLLQARDGLGGETRFWMLDTIHEFAAEQLGKSGEAEQLRRKHAAYFLELAEQAEPALKGKLAQAWLDRLEEEHDNLRSVLDWALGTPGAATTGARLAGALWRFWQDRGYLQEGRGWLELAASLGDQVDAAARAKLLNVAGNLSRLLGDFAKARAFYEQSLTLRRLLGDRKGVASSLYNLGNMAYFHRDYVRARALVNEALTLQREVGDPWGIGLALNSLGNIAREQGDTVVARRLYEESLSLLRPTGDAREIGIVLQNVGEMACDTQDFVTARQIFEEALALRESLGDKLGVACAQKGLADVARGQGDFAVAQALYRQSLTMLQELGDKLEIASCLEALARLLAGEPQQRGRAVTLFAAASSLQTRIGTSSIAEEADYSRELATVRRELDEQVWDSAWAIGQAMSADEAVSYALG
jgi:predicted ATPase/transcriptional regulator with XRE-family HTH domain/Tfp pilus assembly protein PilF